MSACVLTICMHAWSSCASSQRTERRCPCMPALALCAFVLWLHPWEWTHHPISSGCHCFNSDPLDRGPAVQTRSFGQGRILIFRINVGPSSDWIDNNTLLLPANGQAAASSHPALLHLHLLLRRPSQLPAQSNAERIDNNKTEKTTTENARFVSGGLSVFA